MRRFAFLMALALAGCATHDPEFGLVVQNNVLAQVVDLQPVYAGTAIEGSSGVRSVDAVSRLNKGNVKQLHQGGVTKKTE